MLIAKPLYMTPATACILPLQAGLTQTARCVLFSLSQLPAISYPDIKLYFKTLSSAGDGLVAVKEASFTASLAGGLERSIGCCAKSQCWWENRSEVIGQ